MSLQKREILKINGIHGDVNRIPLMTIRQRDSSQVDHEALKLYSMEGPIIKYCFCPKGKYKWLLISAQRSNGETPNSA